MCAPKGQVEVHKLQTNPLALCTDESEIGSRVYNHWKFNNWYKKQSSLARLPSFRVFGTFDQELVLNILIQETLRIKLLTHISTIVPLVFHDCKCMLSKCSKKANEATLLVAV